MGPLQWGRDLSVAEGLLAAPVPHDLGGFNGAATFRSRKGHNDGASGANAFALQWGRDLSVAEGKQVNYLMYLLDRLQWGRDLSVAEGGGGGRNAGG